MGIQGRTTIGVLNARSSLIIWLAGLLPLLKSIHKPCHLKKFGGKTVGVDAYGWLHRGIVSCAVELALGKPTTKYDLQDLSYYGSNGRQIHSVHHE
jgi:hypothetical protein